MKKATLSDWEYMTPKQREKYLALAKRPAVKETQRYSESLKRKVTTYSPAIRGIKVSYQGVGVFKTRKEAYTAGKKRLAQIQQSQIRN